MSHLAIGCTHGCDAIGHRTCVSTKMKGALYILKTPKDSSCVSEGNQPPLARQRKKQQNSTIEATNFILQHFVDMYLETNRKGQTRI